MNGTRPEVREIVHSLDMSVMHEFRPCPQYAGRCPVHLGAGDLLLGLLGPSVLSFAVQMYRLVSVIHEQRGSTRGFFSSDGGGKVDLVGYERWEHKVAIFFVKHDMKVCLKIGGRDIPSGKAFTEVYEERNA